MPHHSRQAYFAIRAFNAELASIKDGGERRRLGRNTETGSFLPLRMRMQWWREALAELYPGDEAAATPEPSPEGFLNSTTVSCWSNPVVRALHHAVEEKQLTRRFLEKLLAAREADLDIQQMATMEDVVFYAEDTCSNLLYLALECAGIREESADEVASNVGIGWGLVTAIRGTLYRANNGEMTIPAEILTRKIPADYMMARMLADYEPNEENEVVIREAVQYMAYQAAIHLNRGREFQGSVPRGGRQCLLPAVPVIQYLSVLRETNYDLWDARLRPEHSRFMMLMLLGRAWITGRF
mmetsp:Transcript_33228/g.76614  ORF Transcript_33228/g.76614 Transcript_33228/m.76614 type:complete len:297 (-) Transcript_33228:89-979(-)